MNTQAELARVPEKHMAEYLRLPVTAHSVDMFLDMLTLRDRDVVAVHMGAGEIAVAYSGEVL